MIRITSRTPSSLYRMVAKNFIPEEDHRSAHLCRMVPSDLDLRTTASDCLKIKVSAFICVRSGHRRKMTLHVVIWARTR